MSSTLADGATPVSQQGAQPGSPDILEELEGEVLKMLESQDATQPGSPDILEESMPAAEPAEPVEPDRSPDGAANGTREVAEGLDPEIADALEADLFGADLFGAEGAEKEGGVSLEADGGESPDLSETELFGPEDDVPPPPKAFGSDKASVAAEQAPPANSAPDPTRAHEMEEQREADEGTFDARTSRYMRDGQGSLLHKWKVDYAPRGGGGRAQCRDSDCLERHDQGGVRTIEKGTLRIARRVLMDKDDRGEGGSVTMMWHHARCIFNTFLRARPNTRVIESEFDIEDCATLNHQDQDTLRLLIDRDENLRNVRFRTLGENGTTKTPEKRGAAEDFGTAAKKRKKDVKDRVVKAGDRVWTHFRCLPREGLAPGVLTSDKSAKPELAMIAGEIKDGSVIVQFESEDHEKERIELYTSKRGNRIKGWLRYPRLFEGRKQRVPVPWVQWNRDPPKLCGCKEQQWGHGCKCGISCSRGSVVTVYGVGTNAGGRYA